MNTCTCTFSKARDTQPPGLTIHETRPVPIYRGPVPAPSWLSSTTDCTCKPPRYAPARFNAGNRTTHSLAITASPHHHDLAHRRPRYSYTPLAYTDPHPHASTPPHHPSVAAASITTAPQSRARPQRGAQQPPTPQRRTLPQRDQRPPSSWCTASTCSQA